MPDKDAFLNELHATTWTGDRVIIRPAQPHDAALYQDFVREVNADDLRLRFWARVSELAGAEQRKLAHLDYKHDMVFIALDEGAAGAMLGLVRLRDALDETSAEFAILVRSRRKAHGIGWLLMRHMIDYARAKGLRRVYADVLAENSAMLQMCSELGFREQEYIGPQIRRVVLDLEQANGSHPAAD